MAYDLRVSIAGDVQLERRLLRMAVSGSDMRPVLTEIADDFNLIETKQFDTQGGYQSGGWKPLAASTVARKLELHQDPRILIATGAMRKSLTRKGAAGANRTITKSSMSLVTTVKSKNGFPYPGVHQIGSSRVPQRRPVELSSQNRTRWVKKLQAWVTTGQTGVVP